MSKQKISDAPDKQLEDLDKLFADGILSESEYRYRRQKLLDSPGEVVEANPILEVYQQDMVLMETVEPAFVEPEPEKEASTSKEANRVFQVEETEIVEPLPAPEKSKKGISRKAKATIIAILAAALVCLGIFVFVGQPEEVTFENGELVKAASGHKARVVKIIGYEDCNAYVYMKCNGDSSKDLAFMVAQGESVVRSVPPEKYSVFVASGEKWSGSEKMFGNGTSMVSINEMYDFSDKSIIIDLEKIKDKLVTSINPGDFPAVE